MSAAGVKVRSVSTPRRRSRSKAISQAFSTCVLSVVVFSLMCAGTFFASSMVGQVNMEKSRKEARAAKLRLIEAQRNIDELQRSIAHMERDSNEKLYAAVNGFIPPTLEEQPQESTSRVAAR